MLYFRSHKIKKCRNPKLIPNYPLILQVKKMKIKRFRFPDQISLFSFKINLKFQDIAIASSVPCRFSMSYIHARSLFFFTVQIVIPILSEKLMNDPAVPKSSYSIIVTISIPPVLFVLISFFGPYKKALCSFGQKPNTYPWYIENPQVVSTMLLISGRSPSHPSWSGRDPYRGSPWDPR